MTLREQGWRVSWVGPEAPRIGRDYGIEFHYYGPGKGKVGRLLHHRSAHRLAATIPEVDVYFAVEPDSAQVAVRLAKAHRAKAIFDIHETYHDDMLDRWVKGTAKRIVGALVRRRMSRICRRSDLVIGAYHSVLAPYEHLPVPKMLLHNCVPLSFGDGEPAEVLPSGREHVYMLHGKATLMRGAREVLQAAIIASERLGRLVKVLMFRVFESEEAEQRFLAALEEMRGAPYVDLRDRVSYHEMAEIMRSSCDLAALMYPRTLGVNGLPNRLFECLATGLPVIGPDYGVEVSRIINAVGCGVLVDTENPDAVAEAIVQLVEDPDRARHMGQLARKAYLERYNWETEVQPMLDHIRRWVQSSR